MADTIHPIVPVARTDQRQAVRAVLHRAIDGPDRMLEQRRLLVGDRWEVVDFRLAGLERRRFEERHDFVQHRCIAGPPDIDGDGIREPQPIVGASRPCAAPARRMPPVLHVAFNELAGGGTKQVGTTDRRLRKDERQDVLKLVAESERAARLKRPAAGPDATAQRLIQQPPVHDQVEGVVRRAHLQGTERVVPEAFGAARAASRCGSAP